jgi:hypothetical protein
MAAPVPTEMIISGTSALRPKKRVPRPDAVGGAVHPHQHGRAVDPMAVQQVDHGQEGRAAGDPLASPDVDGELGRLGQPLGQAHLVDRAGEQAGALQGDQPVAGEGGHLLQRLFDPLASVDRDRDHGQVFGQGEQPLGLQVLARPEPLRTA